MGGTTRRRVTKFVEHIFYFFFFRLNRQCGSPVGNHFLHCGHRGSLHKIQLMTKKNSPQYFIFPSVGFPWVPYLTYTSSDFLAVTQVI